MNFLAALNHGLQVPQSKSLQMIIEHYYKPILGEKRACDDDDANCSRRSIIKSSQPK